MSRKLKAVSTLAAALVLLSGCGKEESEPARYKDGLDYLLELQTYVANTGDTDVYLYLLEDMDREFLLEFMENYLEEAYSDGWRDCEEEYEERRDDWYWDGYCDGEIDGYAFGYAHASGGVPYDEDMIRPPNNGYTGYIPQE